MDTPVHGPGPSAKHVTRVKRAKRVKRAAADEPARGPGLSRGGVTRGGGAPGEPELAAHPALVRARRARGVRLVGAVDARLPQLQVVALPSSLSGCFVAPVCFLRRWLCVSTPFSPLQQRGDLGRQRDAARLRGRPGAGLRAGRADVLGAAEEREPPALLSIVLGSLSASCFSCAQKGCAATDAPWAAGSRTG